MEDVLDVYHAPYDRNSRWSAWTNPISSCGEVHAPLARLGRGQIIDHEYVRNGVAEIF